MSLHKAFLEISTKRWLVGLLRGFSPPTWPAWVNMRVLSCWGNWLYSGNVKMRTSITEEKTDTKIKTTPKSSKISKSILRLLKKCLEAQCTMYKITLVKRHSFNPMFLVNQPAEMREKCHAAGESLLTSRTQCRSCFPTPHDHMTTQFPTVVTQGSIQSPANHKHLVKWSNSNLSPEVQ